MFDEGREKGKRLIRVAVATERGLLILTIC